MVACLHILWARVTPGLTGIGVCSNAEKFDDRPLNIGQNTTGQGCSALVATLNQKSDYLGILNVNRT
jgi:hypothetical protein